MAIITAGLTVCFAAAQAANSDDQTAALLHAARHSVELQLEYDPAYRVIPYPGGDPGEGIGVCTDLVVRAYRAIGIDLQVLVHEDMGKNFSAYPAKKLYGQDQPDKNIDHRRVPNLKAFFTRHGQTLTASIEPERLKDWLPGDIVIFDLYNNGVPTHIGIISDRQAESGRPLVLHHFPPYPAEEDCLITWKILGHYRYPEV